MSNINLHNLVRDNGKNFASIAEEMQVARSTLTRWAQRKVPAERVQELSLITGIPAEQLRPDIFEPPKQESA